MDTAELRERFLALVPSHPPNDWEIEGHLEGITGLLPLQMDLVLSQVAASWSVSHSLCYSYLGAASNALSCLSEERFSDWVRATLDIYEKEGLHWAQQFMADVEANFLCRIRGEAGLDFTRAEKRLSSYARAILARKITLAAGPEIHTDTESIFLPKKLALCASEEENFLLYKLIVTFQLGVLLLQTYEFSLPADHELVLELAGKYKAGPVPGPVGLEDFLALFPDPLFATEIFTLVEGWRVSRHIAAAFPGLWHDTAAIRAGLARSRPTHHDLEPRAGIIDMLARFAMTGALPAATSPSPHALHEKSIAEFSRTAATAVDSCARTSALYGLLAGTGEAPQKTEPVYYFGIFRPDAARRGIIRRRAAAREEFVRALAAVIARPVDKEEGSLEEEGGEIGRRPALSGEDGAMLLAPQKEKSNSAVAGEKTEEQRFLTLAGPLAELPESLLQRAEEIIADLGHIPDEYVSAAQGIAGRAAPTIQALAAPGGESLAAPLTYDEWDFRRSGFRKDWCILLEKELQPVRSTFVDATLEKYRGLLRQLKKQFEMLRSSERFVRRQRDGDDIDLDALIEAIADTRAGKPPSERLFIRLQRDERDIAVLFLVDMSSSTEGWVNRALKESLILMGEALQVLGDRFAVYGFSGMRRSRSDFYRIKEFDESYNEEIKNRIAAIGPREYTRMGPPLRHAAGLLQKVDARVRLLVTLSDGKPEDYDDYKGEYAIEDTRHALIEAKAAGIHPFCITIDREAHDYIGHMYGEVNYIFVDEVRKLPVRLPEIYRVLTT
jgi:nitric oxide reductase NorD protein